MMKYTVGFYIHHHGNGHLMRAIAIASALRVEDVFFLGSNLERFECLIPDKVTCIHLPFDLPNDQESNSTQTETCRNFHYAPLNVKGIRERNLKIASFFVDHQPLIFVVDTSVEILAFARLCGIPTISIQQNGNRNDLPHLLAYDSATEIIAPFPAELRPDNPSWVVKKTVYTGGFSKYYLENNFKTAKKNCVCVLIGAGGSSITIGFLHHLAKSAPRFKFNVLGKIEDVLDDNDRMDNLIFSGYLTDPKEQLQQCAIVIGNAGNNTVMEVATMNKKFICIPEQRPFFEQLDKATRIARAYQVEVILPENLYLTDWETLLNKVASSHPQWQGMINPNAVHNICDRIEKLAAKIYK